MTTRRRILRRGSAAIISVIALATTMAPPMSQASAQTAPGSRGAGPYRPVTLPTGDRVLVAPDRSQGIVRPAPGRERISFVTRYDGGELSVIPEDALGLVTAGRLDPRLFNVTILLDSGYADSASGDLPMLVVYEQGRAALAGRGTLTSAGGRIAADLSGLGGVALRQPKRELPRFWAATAAPLATRNARGGGIKKIWLDGKVSLPLHESVPQVGAPAAWQAGYTGKGTTVAVLDSGVDATHPDLSGKIAEEKNFTKGPDQDTVGHGTHVASTIVGSGAASGGRYKGVAPDARLLAGKVCDGPGCAESAVLAGMLWAAADKRAKVVNLSLGGPDRPGGTPLSEAVDRLSAEHGTLFVVAAGNHRRGQSPVVSSPGGADAALTVGAVDKQDKLADFSNRGPRARDGGIKPDITAPGAAITAARASGTSMGTPVDGRYTTADGTSMATPHVAGAVAILAQQHPDWSGTRLKAGLMGTAKTDPGLTVFEQGAGRLDIARAVRQELTAEPASVFFGRHPWPHGDDQPVKATVTYRNDGPAPITLSLATRIGGPDGKEVPAGLFHLSAGDVQVPARSSAQVQITANTRVTAPAGRYTGHLVATSGQTSVATPFAVDVEGESYDLTIKGIDRAGAPVDFSPSCVVCWLIVRERATSKRYELPFRQGTARIRLPKGRYALDALIETRYGGLARDISNLVQPILDVTRDMTVTVDARVAKPVEVTVPHRSARPVLLDVGYELREANRLVRSSVVVSGSGINLAERQFAHLGQVAKPEDFIARVHTQWAEPGGRGGVTTSPYFYDLMWPSPGRMPTGFVGRPRLRDLATVHTTFAAQAAGRVAVVGVLGSFDGRAAGWPTGQLVTLPSQQTRYYIPGVDRTTLVQQWDPGSSDDPEISLLSASARHRAGRTYQEHWLRAPSAPSTWDQPVRHHKDHLWVGMPMFGDRDGHSGESLYDTGRTALYRNGAKVGEANELPTNVEFAVPQGSATYRLEIDANRSKVAEFSTKVSSVWVFRSAGAAGDGANFPAIQVVRFAPRLDEHNRAHAGTPGVIPVWVERQEGAPGGRVKKLHVEVSYNDGASWQRANLAPAGKQWLMILHHPRNARYVSLRATATDTSGNSVTQTAIRAYGLS